MIPPTQENPGNTQDDDRTVLIDSDAARRALDYYLNPTPAGQEDDEPLMFTARDGLTTAQAMTHAYALLRCAAATAYESADSLQGARRDLAFSVMHMINLARAMVERTLNKQSI
ncbi:DUF6124 family protein [Pseudomonas akapageensis]|uniref:DUF6124 family protein n=1 Tax=Pseudomonas akapageensis TaxID=2609961 RepID=UPI00140937D6|nr:DUF3077 domain-containing protein [Pseudomonas akapageensis]